MAETMSDDLYSDGGDTAVMEETESETTEETAPESDSKSSESGSPGLLPKDFFQGKTLTPGTICKVRVDKVTDGQVLIHYIPHEEKESEVESESSEIDELLA